MPYYAIIYTLLHYALRHYFIINITNIFLHY